MLCGLRDADRAVPGMRLATLCFSTETLSAQQVT